MASKESMGGKQWVNGIASMLTLVLTCMAAPLACAEAFPPPYRFAVQPLGTLPGLSNFDATGINDLGHVIGNATDSGGRLRTFVYDGTGMSELEALSALNASVTGINNAGQIVGAAGNQALMYSSGRVSYLGTGTASSSAAAINEAGQATGWATWETTINAHAVIFENGTVRRLDEQWDTPYSAGIDINEHGDVAARFNQQGSDQGRPVLYYADGRQGYPYLEIDRWSQRHTATALNDAGQMVGWLETENEHSAYMFEDGITHDLYPIARGRSLAYDINNRGQIVGDLGVWEPDGILYRPEDLLPAESPWQVADLELINDRGQVVATACLAGECQLVLLNPVPEPGMGMMLAGGMLMLGMLRLRRRHHGNA